MKPSKENVEILKKLGFELEKFKGNDEYDEHASWQLKDCWGFRLSAIPNFKTLITRLIKTNYNYGFDNAKENMSRLYRPNDH